MRRFRCKLFSTGIILLLLLSNVFAQGTTSNTKTIPQRFQSLVPQGFSLGSPLTSKNVAAGGHAMGGVAFKAFKKLEPGRLVDVITYSFDLKIMEKPEVLLKMQAQLYRDQLEKDIQEELKSCNSRYEETKSSPVATYDKPQLKRYSWGAGITQKVTHKYMGEGERPNEIAYSCRYLGLLIDKRSIKLLDFSVSGVSTPAEANAWAAEAAEKAAQTYVADL